MKAPECPKCGPICRGKSIAEVGEVAEATRSILAPYCEEIEIAGSIRRQDPGRGNPWDVIVHDIEIVARPKFESIPVDVDLFGAVENEKTDLLDEFVRAEMKFGFFTLRQDKNGKTASGARYKRLWITGVPGAGTFPLDLFAVIPPAQWGVIMAIRTGPAEFSKRLVTKRSQGGMLPEYMKIENGALWELTQDDTQQPGVHRWYPIDTPTEADVFKWIRREWIEPWDRVFWNEGMT
jgi:hypothetical protein